MARLDFELDVHDGQECDLQKRPPTAICLHGRYLSAERYWHSTEVWLGAPVELELGVFCTGLACWGLG